MGSELATKWKSLSGENNWEGLLTPDLDVDLRKYLIHYGERVGAVKDALNKENLSAGYGFSRYPPDGSFFANVGLEKGRPFKYEVTQFFYGRAKVGITVEQTAWLGYVAVSTDDGSKVLGRRDILIVWRGTSGFLEWVMNFQAWLTPASDILGEANNPMVHYGWYKFYLGKNERNVDGEEPNYNKTSAREQVLNEVRRLVDKYKDEEMSITVVGHSLGSAMATLNAMDIVANGYNKPTTGKASVGCMVTAFDFAGPRVGDEGFKKVFSELNNKDLHLLRITNLHDLVPLVPFTTETFDYTHIGVNLLFDTAISPYLNTPPDNKKDNKYAHALEVYLHGVAGAHDGINGDFKLVVDRDLALLSKSSDVILLKDSRDEHQVPLNWGVEKNNNMVQQEDGTWKLNGYLPPLPS